MPKSITDMPNSNMQTSNNFTLSPNFIANIGKVNRLFAQLKLFFVT